jgi:hypothetical protein
MTYVRQGVVWRVVAGNSRSRAEEENHAIIETTRLV